MSDVLMPRLSDTMEEGTVLRWLRADGDVVSRGEPLVEIETDKATMTVEAPGDGVLRIVAAEGDTLDVGAPIAAIGEGGGAAAPADPVPDAAQGIPTADDGTADSIVAAFTPAPVAASGPATAASPLARTMAARAGIDLATVRGTGPGGRIVKADVEAAVGDGGDGGDGGGGSGGSGRAGVGVGADGPAEAAPWPAGRRTPLTRLQRTIRRRMDEAASVPDFTLERDVDATPLAGVRADLKVALPGDRRPGVNDFVIRAVAMAAREHPDLVARLEGDDLVVPDAIDVGVAVAVEGGLVVPVVRGADAKGVPAIAAEVRDLATRGRGGTLRPDELEGSVISVTNLGMFGVDRFHAVVNPGEAAILAVGRATPRPVAMDGQVVVRDVMTLALSVDHRIAYGARAATFLGRVAELLAHPAALLV